MYILSLWRNSGGEESLRLLADGPEAWPPSLKQSRRCRRISSPPPRACKWGLLNLKVQGSRCCCRRRYIEDRELAIAILASASNCILIILHTRQGPE